jgi:inorganic pyrophosphatase
VTTSARLTRLPAFAPNSDEINAIVDTPKGSQNKFKYDEESGLFSLGGAMPAGVIFPFEFGFIPNTVGGDGDPLDLLILMDAPTFVGCLVRARLVGVIEAEQKENKQTERNDRLIAVAVKSRRHENIRTLKELPEQLLLEIEHFFISYNAVKGKQFKPRGRHGPRRALEIAQQGARRAKNKARPHLK